MCEICGAPTILDESSVEELLKIPYGDVQTRKFEEAIMII